MKELSDNTAHTEEVKGKLSTALADLITERRKVGVANSNLVKVVKEIEEMQDFGAGVPGGGGGHAGDGGGEAEGVPGAGHFLAEAPAQAGGAATQAHLHQDAPGRPE